MRVFLLLLGLFLSFQASARDIPEVLYINAETRGLDLNPYIWVLADAGVETGIEEISDPRKNFAFKKLTETGNNFGLGQSVYWIKFSIRADARLDDSLLLQYDLPVMDNVTLYSEDGRGGFRESKTGEAHNFSTREIDYHHFLFQLTPLAGQTQTYYLRLQNDGSMQISLSLWTATAFIEHVDKLIFALGIYYGIMLLLAIAALIFFVTMHNRLFLGYFVFLSSFILLQLTMNGLSVQYLWPDAPQWAMRSPVFFLGLTIISASIFATSFLRVWKRNPRLKWFYLAAMFAGLMTVFIGVLGDYTLATIMGVCSALSMVPLVLLNALFSVLSGYRPAKYFLAAWGVFLLGIFVTGLVFFGLLESNAITLYAMQASSMMNILLCGYAVIISINEIHNEKKLATLTANHFLENLAEGLEAKVAERTRELKEKNALLSDLALRDGMTGLLNHNTSIDHLNVMLTSAHRYGHALCVVMIDIDNFKKINDQYGHPVGDIVINAMANVLKKSIRASDSCGRYGGEEFILLLPETAAQNAVDLSENIRHKLMKLRISEINGHQVTASFGVSVFDQAHPKLDLINEADKALYQAKEHGGNQVVLRANMADFHQVV